MSPFFCHKSWLYRSHSSLLSPLFQGSVHCYVSAPRVPRNAFQNQATEDPTEVFAVDQLRNSRFDFLKTKIVTTIEQAGYPQVAQPF